MMAGLAGCSRGPGRSHLDSRVLQGSATWAIKGQLHAIQPRSHSPNTGFTWLPTATLIAAIALSLALQKRTRRASLNRAHLTRSIRRCRHCRAFAATCSRIILRNVKAINIALTQNQGSSIQYSRS